MNPTQDQVPPQDGRQPTIQINDIQVQSVNRSPKDIEQWRNAHISATQVLNPSRSRLYDIYDDILVDGHLSGIIGKRIDTVLNKPLYYQSVHGEKVEAMDSLINSTVFRNILRRIMETLLWGISGMEFIPGDELTFIDVPRKHIKPKWRIISLEQNGITGIPYDNYPGIWIIGENQDLGLLLKCAPYAIYKRGAMADWSNFVEIFGIPMRIIEYDANDEQTKIELRQILDEAGSAMALMIPKQASFKTQDGKVANGDGQLQNTFKDALNAEMSLIILGNTETSTQTTYTGSNAKARTHAQQQEEISKSDLAYCMNSLNDKRFHAILKSYGYPVEEGGGFVFSKDIDIAFLAQRIEVDTRIPANVAIDDSYWYQTYGIPVPKTPEKQIDTQLGAHPKNQATRTTTASQNEPGQNTPNSLKLRNLYTAIANFFN